MMKVIYDSAQDLTLMINKIDKILLLKEKTRNFFDLSLKGFSKTLEAYVFLAYTLDEARVLYIENSRAIENMGRIVIPEPDNKGLPWLIGLSDEGKAFLEDGWNYGIRYNGSNKLFIKVPEF
ncbi:MAG: hypothetical protein ABIH65_01050 [Nanoarchaeota archaeon]